MIEKLLYSKGFRVTDGIGIQRKGELGEQQTQRASMRGGKTAKIISLVASLYLFRSDYLPSLGKEYCLAF